MNEERVLRAARFWLISIPVLIVWLAVAAAHDLVIWALGTRS
jgi:hypothetical protein